MKLKLFIIAWIAAYPTIMLILSVLGPYIMTPEFPFYLRVLIISGCMSFLMIFVSIPLVQKVWHWCASKKR